MNELDEAALDHVEESFAELLDLGIGNGLQGAIEDEQGEAVDGGPCEEFSTGASPGCKRAACDHAFKRFAEQLERIESFIPCLIQVGRVEDGWRNGECGAKETGFNPCKAQIGYANGS